MTFVMSNFALLAQLNTMGTRANGGKLQVYSGTRPANPQTAVTSQVKLLEYTLNNPAFASATMLASNTGQILAIVSGIADAVGLATGTATWGRVLDSSSNVLWDGDVGVSGAGDFSLVTAAISTTSSVTLNSIDLRQGSGA